MAKSDPVMESMNLTELIAYAHWNDLPASRACTREELLHSLRNLNPIQREDPFDAMRETMSRWLKRWWPRLRMQVPKKVCPNCFECRDIQILDCYSRNEASLKSRVS